MGLPPSEITIAEVLKPRATTPSASASGTLARRTRLRPGPGLRREPRLLPAPRCICRVGESGRGEFQQPVDPSTRSCGRPALSRSHVQRRPAVRAASAYMTDYLARRSGRGRSRRIRNRPFFLYLALKRHTRPCRRLRSDYDALSQIEDHTLAGLRCMIRALDRGVGQVLDALRDAGTRAEHARDLHQRQRRRQLHRLPDINRPYRGWKTTFFGGGVRVPFFVKSPTVVPARR